MAGGRIEGSVDRVREFGVDALAALGGQVSDVSALVPGRSGTAVRLASVLAAAGPAPDARYATLESTDGTFAASVELDDLADAVVLYAQGAGPLPAEEGGPFRLLIPEADACRTGGADRCATVKFLGRVTLSAAPGRDTRKVR